MKNRNELGRFVKGHFLSPKGIHRSLKTEFKKGHIVSDEMLRKTLKNRISKHELNFEALLLKFGLPYKFVGNGQIIIEGRCPDFINTNGEKKLIELTKNTKYEWKKNTINHYAKFGFKTLMIDKRIYKRNNLKAVEMVRKFELE